MTILELRKNENAALKPTVYIRSKSAVVNSSTIEKLTVAGQLCEEAGDCSGAMRKSA